MKNLKTKESTIKALERAARHPLSAEEVRRQRVSFIMGTIKSDDITREQVQDILAKQEGRNHAP